MSTIEAATAKSQHLILESFPIRGITPIISLPDYVVSEPNDLADITLIIN